MDSKTGSFNGDSPEMLYTNTSRTAVSQIPIHLSLRFVAFMYEQNWVKELLIRRVNPHET
jgi:hypothetical protein